MARNTARALAHLVVIADVCGIPNRKDSTGKNLQWDDAAALAAPVSILALFAMLALQFHEIGNKDKGGPKVKEPANWTGPAYSACTLCTMTVRAATVSAG